MFGSSVETQGGHARLPVSLISANGKVASKMHAHARELKATRREGSPELRCYLRVACYPSFARLCMRARTNLVSYARAGKYQLLFSERAEAVRAIETPNDVIEAVAQLNRSI